MKYTWKQKLEAVRLYAGSGTYDYPKECKSRARKRSYAKQVKFWHSVYLAKGEEGLMHKTANSSYPPEQKLGMIMPVLTGEKSLTQQAKDVCINSGQLYSWIKKYRQSGPEGLKCSKKGRPGKNTMVPETKEGTKEAASPADYGKKIKDLEHQVALLEFELEYRKKAHALAEKKRISEQRRKRGSSGKSSKARNTDGK